MQISRHTTVPTTLGELVLTAESGAPGPEDEALTGVYFPEHWHPPTPEQLGDRVEAATDPLFATALDQLGEYLAGERQEFELPLRTHGDDFSETVWALLREIPSGTTTTSGELAVRLGSRGLAQRVGQCVGRNPLSIVIPCHRVVGADGSLTGYAGGLERKRTLLELEEPAERSAARLF
jgi:methylated-DNA-[protein]-cysteine S-methyltransferase